MDLTKYDYLKGYKGLLFVIDKNGVIFKGTNDFMEALRYEIYLTSRGYPCYIVTKRAYYTGIESGLLTD